MSEQPLAEGDSTDSDDSDGQDEEHQQVPTDAVESLAWEYEISIERLRPCLIRLRDAFVPGAEELTADKMGWAPIRLLRSSIEALGAEPGIALIKNTDLPALARRLRLIEYPAWHFTPLCTRDKLRVHLGTFLKYQDEVQDFLIRTGLPPREFSDSPWLYLQLGRLYDTRRTGSPYPGPDPGNPYVWVRWPEETVFYGRRWSQQTSFEESSFLKGLDSQDGSRLESLRRRFFAVRRAVIQKLVEALESRQSDTLLQECWEIMEKELSSGEVEFLLQMDPFYLGGNIRDHENTEVTLKMSPGGLTNLLQVVGHVSREIEAGPFHRLWRSVLESESATMLFTEDSDSVPIRYMRLPEGDRRILDAAVDRLIEDQSGNEEFWKTFSHQFQGLLAPNFRVPITVDVQPQYAKQIQRALPIMVEDLQRQAERGGPLIGSGRESRSIEHSELPADVEEQLRQTGIQPLQLRLLREMWTRSALSESDLFPHVWAREPSQNAVTTAVSRANAALNQIRHPRTLSVRGGEVIWSENRGN